MREIWKPILIPSNIEHAYVSNKGMVKYLNGRGRFRTTRGSAQSGGYLQCKLGRYKYLVHILVANQFLERKCNKFIIVHHINGIRSENNVENLQFTSQQLNCSLRMNSSLCIKRNGRFYCKFIFDGVVIKSNESYPTAEMARAKALIMRQRMYDSVYNALIENEENRVLPENNSTPTNNEDCLRICDQSKN